MNPVIVTANMITAYGLGMDPAWSALLAGKSGFAASGRIHLPGDQSTAILGLVPEVAPGRPAVIQMLGPLLAGLRAEIPEDTLVLLATTTGEIELLEVNTLDADESDPSRLLEKVCALCGTTRGGLVISAACASSTVAVAHAAALIRSGAHDSVLVVGCDAVSEFVYAGFATMNAIDPAGSRPFDKDRQGLTLGEAAAAMLLMSDARAGLEQRKTLGTIAGWAMSNDASHVTRPDTGGAQLARASKQALENSGVSTNQIAFISAHGTGTRYNDAMEIAAFKSLFTPRPVFSIKGGLGHTLGAAGLIEIILSLRALQEGVVPPTVGLKEADDDAAEYVFAAPTTVPEAQAALTTNSGFGGINAALVLQREGATQPCSVPHPTPRNLHPIGVGWMTPDAYGRVLRGETRSYSERTTTRLVGSVDALFQRKIESFGRFDPISRMTCYACALALRDAGIDYSPDARQEVGIIGVNSSGSLAANRTYFKDYVDAGRILARGNLFVYTLPSAPIGEAAIHFGFQGPLFATIAPSAPLAGGIEIARTLLNECAAPAMLIVQAEADCALAVVIAPGGQSATGSLSLSHLAELSATHPRLSELIAAISSPTLGGITPCE